MKKEKEVKSKFDFGKKIKEIQIDKTQHVFELTFAVLVFATILLAAIISLGAMVHQWYVWLICGLVLVYFVTHSTLFIIRTWKNPKYTLQENCIVANSIWSYKVIKLNSILNIETKKTVFDKIQKEEMNSLVIHFEDGGKRKAVLHCITEDIKKLISEIEAQKKKVISKLKKENKTETQNAEITTEKKTTKPKASKKKAE